MAKSKQNVKTATPAPKDPSTVKFGCISCVSYKVDVKAFPCKECANWNYWTDAQDNT